LRIVNGIFWLVAWVALSVHFNDINSPPRMIGEAIIPAILWFMIAAEGLASRPNRNTTARIERRASAADTLKHRLLAPDRKAKPGRLLRDGNFAG
jgi:hypothetical protein